MFVHNIPHKNCNALICQYLKTVYVVWRTWQFTFDEVPCEKRWFSRWKLYLLAFLLTQHQHRSTYSKYAAEKIPPLRNKKTLIKTTSDFIYNLPSSSTYFQITTPYFSHAGKSIDDRFGATGKALCCSRCILLFIAGQGRNLITSTNSMFAFSHRHFPPWQETRNDRHNSLHPPVCYSRICIQVVWYSSCCCCSCNHSSIFGHFFPCAKQVPTCGMFNRGWTYRYCRITSMPFYKV